MSIIVKVERFFTRKAKGVLSVVFIESLEKGNLLGYGEFFSTATVATQTESTAVIGTPLALAAVGAGMFLVTSLHPCILLCLLQVAQARGSPAVSRVDDKGTPFHRVPPQAAEKLQLQSLARVAGE